MKRRRALRAVGITSMAALAGCAGIFESAGGYVTVNNDDDVTHTVEILIRDGESTQFETEAAIESGEEQKFQDAFNGGRYTVEVELEDGQNTETDLNVGSCGSIKLLVSITNSGELDVSQSHCD